MSSASTQANIIIVNAKIATLDENDNIVSCLAIANGRVLATGNDRTAFLNTYKDDRTQIIDAGGRTIVPGLTDSHLHFIREGMNFNMEVRWDGVKSLAQGLDMIRKQVQVTPKGQWVRVVGGWCEHQFSEKRLPTLAEINEAGGECPVFVLHLYDCAFVNRIGLEILGYNKDSPNPPSGEIQRGENGNPTGLLIARPNAFLLYNTLNKLPKLSFEDQVNSTLAYQRELHRFGLTSCLDPGGGFQNYPDDYRVIQHLDSTNQLAVRIHYSLFPQKPKQELDDFKRWSEMVSPGDGSPFFKHLGAGEMLAFSAADFEDFKEARPDLPSEMEDELEVIVRFLVSKKWPFRLHATYGESIERELAVFEKIAAEDRAAFTSLRWFIDHAETISERDIKRIHALGGGIAIQHRMAFQGEYFIERYGAKEASHAPPITDMIKCKIPVGAGTDGTRVATYNPWVSLYWLVSGKTVGGTILYGDDAKLSRMDALRAWTANNAWFCYDENNAGRLKPGMYADLAILNSDYFTIPQEEIENIESVLTIVDGKIVYVDGPFKELCASNISSTSDGIYKHLSPEWSPVKLFGGYQLKLSTSWPQNHVHIKQRVKDGTGVDGSVSSHHRVGGSPITAPAHEHAPAPKPHDFFMYGHDC